MKFTILFTAMLCGLLFASCEYDSFDEESGLSNLTTTDTFVRLITGGVDGAADVEVSESNTSSLVTVESQLTTGGAVTVNYALGGTAEYGTIYTIDGATASGGTLSIPFQENEDNNAPARADIGITFLVDTLMAEMQTIELMLTDASSSDGTPVDVGQGPLRGSLVLTLNND